MRQQSPLHGYSNLSKGTNAEIPNHSTKEIVSHSEEEGRGSVPFNFYELDYLDVG